jgi:hypothetical protein
MLMFQLRRVLQGLCLSIVFLAMMGCGGGGPAAPTSAKPFENMKAPAGISADGGGMPKAVPLTKAKATLPGGGMAPPTGMKK